MHIEVQVALNFVISYLYNKLPRRRVNIFGEELERALKDKFRGHWYPEKPFRGSAFRCLKTGDPVDPVLERAARESGVPVQDILENLPHELAVWVDPGEVSYRIGEKGAVKILFNDQHDASEESSADREVTKTFNPEAQCFRPIEVQVGATLTAAAVAAFNLSPSKPASPFAPVEPPVSVGAVGQPVPQQPAPSNAAIVSTAGPPSVTPNANVPAVTAVGPVVTQAPPSSTSPTPTPFKGSPSPVASFLPRSASTLTFTTATFAQTKFGSTKLKTNTKRANRMSPTEFSNYIKQRALQQQQLHHHHHPHHHPGGPGPQGSQGPQLGPQVSPPGGRSISPSGLAAALANDPSGYFFQTPFGQSFGGPRGLFDAAGPPPPPPVSAAGPPPTPYVDPYGGTSKFGNSAGSFLDPHHFYGSNGPPNATGPASANGPSGAASPGAPNAAQTAQADKQLLDSFSNFGLGPGSQYQHLLVAN